jgi:hypothetical protein
VRVAKFKDKSRMGERGNRRRKRMKMQTQKERDLKKDAYTEREIRRQRGRTPESG